MVMLMSGAMSLRNNRGSHMAALKVVFCFLAIGNGLSAPAHAAPPGQKPAPAKASAQSVNAFQQEAGKLGVRRCANLFSTLGQSLTNGSTYAVQVQANRAAPDAHAVSGVAGMSYKQPEPDYSGSAVGIALAAPVGGACEGQLVRVTPFQKACTEVVKLLPQGSTVAGNLSGVPLYNLGGNQGQALMVASGATCVVVSVAHMADAK